MVKKIFKNLDNKKIYCSKLYFDESENEDLKYIGKFIDTPRECS